MLSVGIVGCGNWGNNYVRLATSSPEVRLVACADSSEGALQAVRRAHPDVQVTTDAMALVRRGDLQAVIVATPPSSHHAVVKEALRSGKDVLCEKPLTTAVAQAEELVAVARETSRILMTGHIFVYNAGIRRVREYMSSGECGNVLYLHAVRTNLGPFRQDVNVVWDLAPHDLSIFSYLLGTAPVKVWAQGESFLRPGAQDVAFVTLAYPNHVLGHLHVSWLDPRKVRQMTVVGDRKMICWDDLDSIGPVRVYDKGVARERRYDSFGEFCLLSREGDITIPRVTLGEPLKAEFAHFLECVLARRQPVTDAVSGLQVVKALAAIDRSLQQNGAVQEVEP